ncbi:SRPBCC family protein [Qipengyuania atrilutea]|uniref:SRPBCC family protein n=1 Tax=Qipengyuania atrilutea TaxID=2744473 RepID=UPI001C3C3DFF|nr:SRPBCC family protein [Actirhodobacter atriluteus]
MSILSATLSASPPAAAEVIAKDANGFTTRNTQVIAATPAQVWLALISPGKWWSDDHTWSGDAANMTLIPQGGGCFCETIPGTEDADTVQPSGSAKHMEVMQANPHKVLRMRGGLGPLQSEPAEGVLTITMQPDEGGTKVVFEYVVGGPMRFEIPVIALAVDGVLSQQLAGLKAYLESGGAT